jgi:predicted phosphodiesterase
MRIQIFSDLHTDIGARTLPDMGTDADVVIDAGDHRTGVLGLIELAEWFPKKELIYVAGNHEFYGKRIMSKHYQKMREKAGELGIHFLQNNTVILDGISFTGATLWTSYNQDDPLAKMIAKDSMNDYRQIFMDICKPMLPYYLKEEHDRSVEYIASQKSDVVITHHAPSFKSIHPKYGTNLLNHAYASDLSELILNTKPKLWVHGHTHCSHDYMIGDTRVLANPKGYELYRGTVENDTFNPSLVVQL